MSQPPNLSLEDYNTAFDVPSKDGKQKFALEQALDIRKFEIGLYWTRAAYFWAFIGVALAAFGGVRTFDEPEKTDFSVFVSCVGFLSSFAWYCVNRGSKQWQENWENHVDLLEDDVSGPLYKTVITRPAPEAKDWIRTHLTGPYPFSVSKINQIISVYMMALWVFLLFYALPTISFSSPIDWWYVVAIGLTVAATCGILHYGKSDPGVYTNIAKKRESNLADPASKKA